MADKKEPEKIDANSIKRSVSTLSSILEPYNATDRFKLLVYALGVERSVISFVDLNSSPRMIASRLLSKVQEDPDKFAVLVDKISKYWES